MSAESEEYGELALVIGDLHIPFRATEIPPKAKETLTPNHFPHVICTGNLGGRQPYDWVRSLSQNTHFVRGDFEEPGLDFPEEKVIEIKGNRIGIIHGHQIVPWGDQQALANKARQMNVDLLISGHTHCRKLSQHSNVTLLNPGSLTGALSPLTMDVSPSFLIIQFKTDSIVVYPYEVADGEVVPGENITINK